MVTRDLPKVETTGSSPVARSARFTRAAAALFLVAGSVVSLLRPSAARAGPLPPPAKVADHSTLTILRGDGQYSEQARGPIVGAVDGQDVAVGDRLITGAAANLLLTFFEGSTLALSPGTDLIVERLQGDATARDFSLRLNLGTIWARIVSFGTSSATFQVQAPNAVAVVRGSQIGARVLPDGTFQCWTREGQLDLSTVAGGQTTMTPGQTVVVQPDGQLAAARVFTPATSMLRFQVDGPAWPVVVHPDGGANGVVDPGIVVSQTFGALVDPPAPGSLSQGFEVPANVDGEFTLVLEGQAGPPNRDYAVAISGLLVQVYDGVAVPAEQRVEQVTLRGALAPGERVAYVIHTTVDRPGEQDAVLQALAVAGPQPIDGPALGPARVLVSPVELGLAGLAPP